MAYILVFGDSITYGAWDFEEGGWVSRLRKFLDKIMDSYPEKYYLVYNLGISGDNTDGLLSRFELETKPRIRKGGETLFIFAIGINDSQFVHSKNKNRISIEKFEKNIQKLINLAQKFSSKIIFIGLTPVDETKTTPIPWNTDKYYKNEYIQKYNNIIKNICNKRNIFFIDLFEMFQNLNYQALLEDGLHPNAEGHKKIFEIVKDFLIRNKLI